MIHKLLNIKVILLFFIVLIALVVIFSIVVFFNQHSQLQNQLAHLELQQTVTALAQRLEREIKLAEQNVHRLKEYVSILDTDEGKISDKVTFIQDLMKENLQFENSHYSHYVAMEPFKAKELFKQRGQLLLVHKNNDLRSTARYNKPQYMRQRSWKEPNYANDPSDPEKFWYHQSKPHTNEMQNTNEMQITSIYYDTDYTKSSVFSISQGLYNKDQSFEGVVGISILVDTFFEDIEKQKFGHTGGMLLADSKKGLLLSKIGKTRRKQFTFLEATERQSVNLYSHKQPFWQDILKQNTSYREVENHDGNLYSLSSKRLWHLPWTLVGYQQTDELKQGKSYDSSFFLKGAIIILVLLALMVWVFFKTLISPLLNLFNVIQGVRHPNKICVDQKSVVEIHLLADVFRQMATEIVKINNEKAISINRLEASSLTTAKLVRKLKQYHAGLVKSKRDKQNCHEKIQKANLQIQKARLAIQKYKLEAKRAKVQSYTANRAKAQFLANMSHELRTPMNAIIGYTEILQEDAKEWGQKVLISDLQKIHGASYHLLDLINNLFDMSKIESSQMDLYINTFDIAPMIQDVASTIAPLLEKQSNILKVNCAPALGTMTTDLTKVRQNLLNLLTNANKFSKQSTISLTVTRKSINHSDWILFCLTDQGIGMTEAQIQKLFQAFSSLDAAPTYQYSGSGLGLAITKQFCQILGGDIFVESKLGEGSTFTMQLPAQVSPSENL
jgi:signal transduction histidine kinase